LRKCRLNLSRLVKREKAIARIANPGPGFHSAEL
jgi:hypothetical protein